MHVIAGPSVASRWDRRFEGCTLADKLELIIVPELKDLDRVLTRASLGDHNHQRKRLETLFRERETGAMRLLA